MELAEGLAPPMNRGLQPRAFATRPRQHGAGRRSRTSTLLGQSQRAYQFAHPRSVVYSSTGTRPRTWTLRVQSATCYRFHHPCARMRPKGWRSSAATPCCVVARTRNHTRSTARERARARARGVVISIFNVGIQGVKGQGPSSTDQWSVAIPVTGQRKRTWRWPGPWMSERWSSLLRILSSHLPGLAANVAEAALRDPRRPPPLRERPSADGLADLLWSVMMTPEFQLIR